MQTKTIKVLIITFTVTFFLALLDGMFEFGFSDGIYTFIGAVQLVTLIWLLVLVFKKPQNSGSIHVGENTNERKFCDTCGKDTMTGANFCKHCGARLAN